ncbi:uncharacterized protein [Physcomitrium patens]|uniref:uncharacterized protein isoform X1 n=1 Tax=Physcomitrium patens TaxID=3218 RepID=UPI003CCE0E91
MHLAYRVARATPGASVRRLGSRSFRVSTLQFAFYHLPFCYGLEHSGIPFYFLDSLELAFLGPVIANYKITSTCTGEALFVSQKMFTEGVVERMTGWKHRNSWLRAAETSDILKDVQKRGWYAVCS